MLAVGVGRARAQGWNIDPGDQCGVSGQYGLDLAKCGDLSLRRAVSREKFYLELVQGNAGQLTLVLELFEMLRTAGFVQARRPGFRQFIEPFQCGGQFAKAGSLGRCEPPVLACGQLVEKPASQVSLERLPRLGRLTEPGQHRGQGEAS